VSRLLLEVIVQTVADAVEAAKGGADRLEVVRDIAVGGLTPRLALVREIAAETALPLRVMVRENKGYATDARELIALRATAAEFAAIGVDGLVVGFADPEGISLADVAGVLEATPATRATFHRAFDCLVDPLAAIDDLHDLAQIDRILTSGGDGALDVRCGRLAAFADRAGERFGIIAGGGVTEALIERIARSGCVREVHVGRAARDGNTPDAPVSAARVRYLRELASTT
jgi:copper homeostasis protein